MTRVRLRGGSTEDLAFDPETLRERYRSERDRRVRVNGNAQYVRTAGRFEHYLDDPHADPGFVRAPVVQSDDVVIVGGGFGGLLDMRVARNNQYWRGPIAFVKRLDRWRQDGSMPGLQLSLDR